MSNEILKYVAQCGFLATALGVPQIEDPSGNWAPIVPSFLALDPNTRYVSQGGSDVVGTGSLGAPFLTVQAAINACVAAGPTPSNPFMVSVAPGTYTTPFKLAANVFVVGSGSAPGNFNATPVNGITNITPNAVNSIDASCGGAANAGTGIFGCGLLAAFVCDWSAVASTGNSRCILAECMTQSAVTFTGNNANNYPVVRNLYINNTVDLTFTNVGAATVIGYVNDFSGNLVMNQTATYAAFTSMSNVLVDHLVCNTAAGSVGKIFLQLSDITFNEIIFTGTGAEVLASGISHVQTVADAAGSIGFGFTNTATIIGISFGRNVIQMTPTANRLLTLNAPVGAGFASTGNSTFMTIKNFSPTFNIDLAFAGIMNGIGPTYVPPLGQVDMFMNGVNWVIEPYVQSGSVALVNGLSPAIKADITANSRITATLQTYNGVCGTPIAPSAGRTVGTRAGAGQFILHAITPGTGADTATDQGTYNWQVVNS